jgi:membrane protein DedA with SNARE-associated domain
VEALQEFVNNFTYLGIFAVLLLGGLGVPIPEEMPIIAAAVLSHGGIVRWRLALPVCLLGVLSGDMVLYWVARHVLGLRAAAFLTAGSSSVPFWKFVVADAGAALFGVPLTFGLAYFFTDQIKAIMADVHRAERWLALAGLMALVMVLVVGVWRWHRRVAKEGLGEESAERHSPPR